MYSHGERQDPSIAQQCATENDIDWGKLSNCYQGEMGHELELMYYNETASLNPPHQYTPWVTINGKVCARACVCVYVFDVHRSFLYRDCFSLICVATPHPLGVHMPLSFECYLKFTSWSLLIIL